MLARGAPGGAPRTTGGRGTGRYDTQVIITGPAYGPPDSDSGPVDSGDSDSGDTDLSGFWPCVPCYYNPVEDVWVEFDEALAIPANGEELEEGRRYRGLCCGTVEGMLVFEVNECCGSGGDSDSGSDDTDQPDCPSVFFEVLSDVVVQCADGSIAVTKTFKTITVSINNGCLEAYEE